MESLVIQSWCQDRICLIAGLLSELELKEAQIPATAEKTEAHFLAVADARLLASTYIERLQYEPEQVYLAYPHDAGQLQVGRLLVPSPDGYQSLPWRSEELPTVLHLLALEAEAIAAICQAKNILAKSSWMLIQVRAQLSKIC